MKDSDSIGWLVEYGSSADLRLAKEIIDSALRAKLEYETQSDRYFEYGVALKAKGFGYVTIEVPALGINKGIQYQEGDDIDAIAIEIIKQHFEDDWLCEYGQDYAPPRSDWAVNFPEYADHAWRFVTVLTPVSPSIEEKYSSSSE
ncbi:hypothetical protein ACX3OY_23540 [Citrobacter farmeri]